MVLTRFRGTVGQPRPKSRPLGDTSWGENQRVAGIPIQRGREQRQIKRGGRPGSTCRCTDVIYFTNGILGSSVALFLQLGVAQRSVLFVRTGGSPYIVPLHPSF